MTERLLCRGLLLGFLIVGAASTGLAQSGHDPGSDFLTKLQRDGWETVQDGVLRRELNPNEVETFVFGEAGLTWKLRDLRAQLRKLQAELAAHPTPELRQTIASHHKAIASIRERIERARATGENGETFDLKVYCVSSIIYEAEASYKTDRQGTWAAANAEYSVPPECYGSGEVYAYAFAKTTVSGAPTTATVTDGPRSGANVSATADANRNGGPSCESYAFASVTEGLASYSKSKTNESCAWPAPLYVSVQSDKASHITLDEWECVNITWTVNISGGVPGYTSKLYRNNVLLGNGLSYSENVCNDMGENYPWQGVDITIRADVTDSAAQTTSASQSTRVDFIHWRP